MQRPVTRRAVLAGGIGLAAAATGCTTSGPATTALPHEARSGRARAGGEMRIARPPASSAETLDPASSLSAYEYLGALYNRITRIGRDGQVAPDLAEEWDATPDAMRWTFRIRAGVTFHDGRPCSARDAAYTVRRMLDPDLASPQHGVLAPLMEPAGVRAPDDHTLVIDLLTPNAELPSLLTGYNCYVIAEDSGDTVGATGNGTGPFRLDSFTAAGRGRIVANDEYWGGRPTLDSITFFSIADQQARTNALLAGQVDLLSQTNLDFVTARVVNASSDASIARVRNGQWYTIPMLTSMAPFDDPDVRRAVKLAYDPQRVLRVAAQGAGELGHDNPVPPDNPAWADYSLERDPDRARALLRRSGHEGLTVDMYTSSYDPVFTPMALAFRDTVADAGITVNVKNAAADSYYSQIWMQRPLMATYWYTGRPVDQLLNQIFRSGSSYNETAWADDEFDAMLDAARREIDDDRRRSLYQDAQRYLVDDSGSVTPMFADRLVGIADSVVNYYEHGFEFDYLSIGFGEDA